MQIAYDGSPAATRALRSFAASGLARGRELHVTTVQDDGALEVASAPGGGTIVRAHVPQCWPHGEPTAPMSKA